MYTMTEMGEIISWLSNYNKIKSHINIYNKLPTIFEFEYIDIVGWLIINITYFYRKKNIMSDERFYSMFNNFLINYKYEIQIFCDENITLLCKYVNTNELKHYNSLYVNMLLYNCVEMTINGKFNNSVFNTILYINSNIFNYLDHKTSYKLYCYIIENSNNDNLLTKSLYDYLFMLPNN